MFFHWVAKQNLYHPPGMFLALSGKRGAGFGVAAVDGTEKLNHERVTYSIRTTQIALNRSFRASRSASQHHHRFPNLR